MPIQYKINVLEALKDAGYSSYKLRQDKILGESTISKIRKGEIVSAENLAILCELLQCQVGDLIEYRPNSTENGVQNQQEKN
jgi:putative transcriptional regulator